MTTEARSNPSFSEKSRCGKRGTSEHLNETRQKYSHSGAALSHKTPLNIFHLKDFLKGAAKP